MKPLLLLFFANVLFFSAFSQTFIPNRENPYKIIFPDSSILYLLDCSDLSKPAIDTYKLNVTLFSERRKSTYEYSMFVDAVGMKPTRFYGADRLPFPDSVNTVHKAIDHIILLNRKREREEHIQLLLDRYKNDTTIKTTSNEQ